MIPKECKRIAEVDFPIGVVSAHSAREKSIRHGHPSTLHLWWAHRPLAACRSMLLALLLPDPCDAHCPAEFKKKAWALLPSVQGEAGPKDIDLPNALLRFIGDFANWDLAANPRYLEVGRGLVKAAHLLAATGNAAQAGGATPIAYLWARTVRCESPNCGAEIPLMRSFWLCKKSSRLRALRAKVLKLKDKTPQIELEVFAPKSDKEVAAGTVTRAKATCLACERVLAPDRVRAQLREQRGGADTIFEDRNGGTGFQPVRVGGARLLAVVTLKDNKAGRQYRVAAHRDYEVAWKAQRAVAKLAEEKLPNGISVIPDEPLPPQGTLGFRVQLYGMTQWGDLFTARQKLALATFDAIIAELAESNCKRAAALSIGKLADFNPSLARWAVPRETSAATFGRRALPIMWDYCETAPIGVSTGSFEGANEYAASVVESLSLLKGQSGEVHAADAAAYPLPDDSAAIWFTDSPYYDAVPYAELSDFFYVWLKRSLPEEPLMREHLTPKNREIVQDETKRFDGGAKDREFFERRMAVAFADGRRALKAGGVGSVVFAHKTTEGWEALLSGMTKGGWTITGSWPVATEMGSRLRARESAALATSVHLVCRPRPKNADVGDWGDVLRELPTRIGDWMERLSAEGVRGADLVFACIGPAMEIYSRYSKVEDAEGREIPLGGNPEASEPHKRGFLAYVWETVGRTALGQVLGTAEARARNGAAGALEEDARLTALFLWTLQSTSSSGTGFQPVNSKDESQEIEEEEDDTGKNAGATKKGLSLIYDVVRRFSQPLGIHLENWNDRIISTEKGIVRLLPITERAQHLLGEDGATGVAEVIERNRGGPINYQFAFAEDAAKKTAPATDGKGRKRRPAKSSDEAPTMQPGTTTLDRVHIAMLLQSAGKSNALRTMLKAETDRAPDFLRLANALSALYPKDSEEKRLLDAMLLAVR